MGFRALCVSEEPKGGLTCVHCRNLLRSPVQTEDGLRLCRTCFDAIWSLPDRVCQHCEVTLTTDQCFPDRAVEREVQALLVWCQFRDLGCSWQGQLKNWEDHIKGCSFKGVPCPHSGCGQLFAKSDLEDHMRDCPYGLIECKYCHLQVSRNRMKEHESECEEMVIVCAKTGCSASFPRRELSRHLEESCVVVKCLTCGTKVERSTGHEVVPTSVSRCYGNFHASLQSSELSESHSSPASSSDVRHMTSSCGPSHLATSLQVFEHHQQLARQVQGVEGMVSEVQRKQALEKEELISIAELVKKMQTERMDLRAELDSVKDDLTKTRQELDSTRQLASGSGRSHEKLQMQVQSLVTSQQTTQETLLCLKKRVEEMKKETKDNRVFEMSRKTGVTENLYSHSNCESSTLQQLRVTEELQKQMASMKVQLAELELQLQASLASTYNGSFIWRIPDVTRRRRDAIDGHMTSIYSPPFYTGRNGYKMCIRGYLNGDGMGYQSHLSLFFVIMRGECDPLLKWPFEYKVSMILVDQTHRKHIVQTFKPTPESSSFQRPKTEMNVASGCPQFAKLNVLDDPSYVKDDVMFIKCIVDTTKIFHP